MHDGVAGLQRVKVELLELRKRPSGNAVSLSARPCQVASLVARRTSVLASSLPLPTAVARWPKLSPLGSIMYSCGPLRSTEPKMDETPNGRTDE